MLALLSGLLWDNYVKTQGIKADTICELIDLLD